MFYCVPVIVLKDWHDGLQGYDMLVIFISRLAISVG